MSRKTSVPGWPSVLAPLLPGAASAGDPLGASMTGGFDFIKNLWGGFASPIPGLVVPTIDVEELDKRIKDLKAVESWLEVNASMLRGTIQALEVQRNTVATLKSLGGSLGSGASGILETMGKAADVAAGPTANTSWPDPVAVKPRSRAPRSAAAKSAPPPARPAADAPAVAGGNAPGTAWLEFLQNQFNQVALAALSAQDVPASKKGSPAKAANTTRKAAGRTKRG